MTHSPPESGEKIMKDPGLAPPAVRIPKKELAFAPASETLHSFD